MQSDPTRSSSVTLPASLANVLVTCLLRVDVKTCCFATAGVCCPECTEVRGQGRPFIVLHVSIVG